MQQFYSWFEELGEDNVEEEKYRNRIETLKSYRDYCDKILKEIESAADLLQVLHETPIVYITRISRISTILCLKKLENCMKLVTL
jgi:hypothetical protein